MTAFLKCVPVKIIMFICSIQCNVVVGCHTILMGTLPTLGYNQPWCNDNVKNVCATHRRLQCPNDDFSISKRDGSLTAMSKLFLPFVTVVFLQKSKHVLGLNQIDIIT